MALGFHQLLARFRPYHNQVVDWTPIK
jgi:hypothetical protein